MKIYLVQRGHFKDTKMGDIVGVDSLIEFEYMGSAEFEFGALSDSMRRIVKDLGDYQFKKIENLEIAIRSGDEKWNKQADGDFRIFCKKNQFTEIEEFLIKVCADFHSVQLKEPFFDIYYSNDFWWDVENDWIIIKGNKIKQRKLTLALEKLKQKWNL